MECDTAMAARIHYTTLCSKGWVCDPSCIECVRIREQYKTTGYKKPHTCNWVNIRPTRNIKPQMPEVLPQQVDIQHVAEIFPFWEEKIKHWQKFSIPLPFIQGKKLTGETFGKQRIKRKQPISSLPRGVTKIPQWGAIHLPDDGKWNKFWENIKLSNKPLIKAKPAQQEQVNDFDNPEPPKQKKKKKKRKPKFLLARYSEPQYLPDGSANNEYLWLPTESNRTKYEAFQKWEKIPNHQDRYTGDERIEYIKANTPVTFKHFQYLVRQRKTNQHKPTEPNSDGSHSKPTGITQVRLQTIQAKGTPKPVHPSRNFFDKENGIWVIDPIMDWRIHHKIITFSGDDPTLPPPKIIQHYK